jgi:hypothetical protein
VGYRGRSSQGIKMGIFKPKAYFWMDEQNIEKINSLEK